MNLHTLHSGGNIKASDIWAIVTFNATILAIEFMIIFKRLKKIVEYNHNRIFPQLGRGDGSVVKDSAVQV